MKISPHELKDLIEMASRIYDAVIRVKQSNFEAGDEFQTSILKQCDVLKGLEYNPNADSEFTERIDI